METLMQYTPRDTHAQFGGPQDPPTVRTPAVSSPRPA